MDRTSPGVRDAGLIATKPLPSAGGGMTASNALDLGPLSARGIRPSECELLLSAPALTATQLPNGASCAYAIEASELANFASVSTLASSAIVQTGNSGAPAATYRLRLPSHCPRYVRAKAATASNAGDCSGASMTFELLF